MANMKWHYKPVKQIRTDQNLEFYQLAEFYDEKLMLSYFRDHLKGIGVADRGEILNVWYIPKRKFQVLYRVSCGQEMAKEIILLVRFYQVGKSAKQYKKALTATAYKEAVLHLAGCDAVGWIFPEDAKLSSLRAMFDKQNICLRIKKHIDIPIKADQIVWNILSYLPGNRCSVLYNILSTNYRLIGKIQDSSLTIEYHSKLVRLWKASKQRFRTPCPIGLDKDLGVRWETYVTGESIEDKFLEISWDSLIKEMAHNLVTLHQLHIDNLQHVGFKEQVIYHLESKTIPRIQEALLFVEPELISKLHKILIKKADLLPKRSIVTIHGDFHPANIILGQEGLIFIDMDSLAIGEPAYDLAYFSSRLLLMAIYRNERIKDVVNAIAYIPDAYESAGGTKIHWQTFTWYIGAFILSREIKSCILHRAPELERLARQLLAYAYNTVTREVFDASIISDLIYPLPYPSHCGEGNVSALYRFCFKI